MVINYPKMSTVRLALNDETEKVMTLLEKRYRPMSRAEILKMALAKFTRDELAEETVEILDSRQSARVDEAIKELNSGKGKVYRSVDELIEDLES